MKEGGDASENYLHLFPKKPWIEDQIEGKGFFLGSQPLLTKISG